ncbi:MAG: FHA domain-containing protein [Myxococcota bacterium]
MSQDTGSSPQLLLLDEDRVVMAIPIDGAPVLIGRSSLAQVRLGDSLISRMHAMVWVESGALWVQDLNSTNGTFLDGEQLNEPAQVTDTARLSLGDTELRLMPATEETAQPNLWLESLEDGKFWPLSARQYALGDDANADIHLPGAAATLAVENGEAALVYGTVRMPLTADKIFRVGSHRLRLRDSSPDGATTMEPSQDDASQAADSMLSLSGSITNPSIQSVAPSQAPEQIRNKGLPYRFSMPHLDQAIVEDMSSNKRCVVTAENRTALLLVLARQLSADRQQRKPPAHQGWCSDDDVGVQVWGRRWWTFSPNRLHVLLHRTRSQLKSAGMSVDCLQKKRGWLRLWIEDVALIEEPTVYHSP